MNYTTGFFTSAARRDKICVNPGPDPKRKEEFIVDRCTFAMRHKHLGFLQCSFKKELCFALLCPDETHEIDLKRRML